MIGDSHAAALKIGWTAIQREFPETQLVFFASGANSMQGLTVSAGYLIPSEPVLRQRIVQSSGGREAIANDFAGYILCGLGFAPARAVHLSEAYRVESSYRDSRCPISDECFQYAVEGILRRSLATETLLKLREITPAPIAVIASPMRSETDPYPIFPVPEQAQESGHENQIAALFVSAAYRVAQELDFKFFPQPTITLKSPLYTRELYSRAANIKPHETVLDSHHIHMNGKYGSEVLRSILTDFPAKDPTSQTRG